MISRKFEDEIWIYFQTNLSPRTRKEYWNVVRNFDKIVGHDPCKLTRKDATSYFTYLVNRVNEGKLTYNTAVMRLSVIRSVCDFIKNYTENHGRKYNNYFTSFSLPDSDKLIPKDAIPTAGEINDLLSLTLENKDIKAFLIFSMIAKMGLTNQEICSLNKEYIIKDSDNNLCISFPPKNRRVRVIAIPDDIAHLLDEYTSNQGIVSGAVFLNSRNNRIKLRDTERMLVSYTEILVKKNKIKKHYTLQTLRHAAIIFMLKGNASKENVAKYMGITTKWMNRYDTIVNANAVEKAVNYSVITINPNVYKNL